MCKCLGEQVVPSTEKAAKFVFIIKILCVLQLAVAIMDLVASPKFIREGIFGLFLPILLVAGFYKLSHQSMMIYTFMSMFFSIVFLVYILQIVQQGQNISKFSSQELRHFIIACISLGFYLGTSVFSFYPYREFKAIEYADNPAFADFINMKEEKKVSEEELRYNSHIDSSVPEPKDKRKKGTFQIFQGQGIRIG